MWHCEDDDMNVSRAILPNQTSYSLFNTSAEERQNITIISNTTISFLFKVPFSNVNCFHRGHQGKYTVNRHILFCFQL
jgi:hypothetical protein